MTEESNANVSICVSNDDEAFLRSNSLNDIKVLITELSDLGEDTTDISDLVGKLESLYEKFSDVSVTSPQEA